MFCWPMYFQAKVRDELLFVWEAFNKLIDEQKIPQSFSIECCQVQRPTFCL